MACRTTLLGFVAAMLAAGGNSAGVSARAAEAADQKAVRATIPPPKADRLGKPVPLEVDGQPLTAWGTPFVGDFDGDGLPDLLLGEGQAGRLQVYRNVGTKTVPRLSGPQWFDDLVPTGRIPKG